MNPEPQPKPRFDLTLMRQASNGNAAFMQRMIGLFCAQTTETIAAWEMAMAHNDYDVIRQVAHKIKPTLDALFVEAVHHDIRWLETIDPGVNLRHDVSVVLERVGQMLGVVTEELKSLDSFTTR